MPRTFAAFRAAFSRGVRSAFTQNLPYKGAALFLSLVLWFVIERQTPRTQLENVEVGLEFRLDNNLVRISPLPEVKARISVLEEDQLQLDTERPTIRRSFGIDVDDTVVVTIRPRDVELPEDVNARVLDVFPATFVVRFDSVMQKTVPIQSLLRFVADTGFAISGAARFEPDSVNIVGRRQVVAGISSVSTESREIVVRDSAAISITILSPAPGIEVVPQTVMARVPIVRTDPP